MYILAAGWYISVASRMCASARDEVGNVASRMCASAIERYQPTPPHPIMQVQETRSVAA